MPQAPTMDELVARYRALRAERKRAVDCCLALIAEYGISHQEAAAVTWAAQGQRAPHPDDHRATGRYYRAAERHDRGY